MTKEEKEYMTSHRTALIRVCQDKGILLIEFSTDAARSSVSKYFEKDFGFVSSEKEVGELSASKKRIFRADVASSAGLDACRIKQIADHLKAAKVEVRYRLGEEEDLHSDWESYVQSLCKRGFLQRRKKSSVPTAGKGCNGIRKLFILLWYGQRNYSLLIFIAFIDNRTYV